MRSTVSDSLDSFYVVGVGASAGGLEALESFCSHIPPDLNCAFIVVTHLDPTHKSMMSELLARHTTLQVKQIDNGEVIEPGTIYMIPPNRELAIDAGRLVTIEHAQPRGFRTPINTFFTHLAREYREHAIAVILSGSGTDGAESLANIKKAGGLVLIQNPEEAKYSGMPASALATGSVDCVESAQALPELISRYMRHELIQTSYEPSERPVRPEVELASAAELKDIFEILRRINGHDFSTYKQTTLQRRLARRVESTKSENVGANIDLLKRDGAECEALFNEFLINVTRSLEAGVNQDWHTFTSSRSRTLDFDIPDHDSEKEFARLSAGKLSLHFYYGHYTWWSASTSMTRLHGVLGDQN